MAAEAQQVDLILVKKPLIRRTMRRVADHAAFNLCFVLVNEWSLLFAMALVANFVAGSIRAQLLGAERAMGAMTIVALDQAFIDTMMEWPRELRTHIHMTLVTKLRRFRLHQKLTLLGMVRRMAVNTRDSILEVD